MLIFAFNEDIITVAMRRFLLSVGFIVLIGQLAFAQNPFRTRQSGNWNDPNTWEEDTGGGFAGTANTPTSASGAITVRNTHTVTVNADVTIDQVTIQVGGTLQVDALITLSIADGVGDDLSVNGTFNLLDDGFFDGSIVNVSGQVNNTSIITLDNGLSSLNFLSGSLYRHSRDGGSLPLSNWNTNSTCEISGITSNAPSQSNQNFGNFNWNCAGQSSNITLAFSGTVSLGGSITILNSGATPRLLIFSNTNGTIVNISGNLNVTNSARFAITQTGNPVTMNISGNYVHSSSGLSALAGGTSVGTLNVTGNFQQSAGELRGNSGSSINFTGSGVQVFTGGGGFGINNLNSSNFVIGASSTLDMGTSFLSGLGTLTVNGSIRVGALDVGGAIQLGTANGNIRVGPIRTYNSGSSIIYNGTSAQFIGSGHPQSSNTTINNSNGVTLASDVTINGSLTLTSGNLNVASNTLTLGSTFTPNANSLGVTSSSSLSIGGSGISGNLPISGGPVINNFTLDRSGGSAILTSSLTIAGSFTQTAGDLVLNGNTLTISGTYSRTSGNLSGSSSSSIVVNGSGSLPAIGISGGALNTFTMNRGSNTLVSANAFTVSNLNILTGTFQNDGTIAMASGGAVLTRDVGTITGIGVITALSSYDVVYTNSNVSPLSTGSELPASTSFLRNLTIASTGRIDLSAAVTVNGTLTFSNGVFNAGSNPIDLKGNLVSNNTSSLTSSAITFSGATSVTGTTAPVFGNITITGSLTPTSSLNINGNLVNNGTLNSGSATVTFGGTTAISGTSICSFNNLVISPASSLIGPLNGTINVAGTWTNNGTFTDNGGTVVFNGTSSITGATNFGGVTITGTLTSPASLNVARNFTNNGTFVAGSGTLVLNGSSIQSISGTTTTTFNNITVTNTAGPPAVQVQSNQNLQGVLTLSANSQFDADGSSNTSVFTLLSTNDNSTSDASIAALPSGASVTGNVTVQRFMAIEGGNNTRIYRFISSPVQSAPVSQIQTFIPVTGTFSGASSCSGCGTSQSMFAYDESVITGDQNAGYINFPAAGNSETFTSGRGYSIFVRGNTAPISTAGNARWSLTGPINSGSINFNPFTTFNSSGTLANDGWNLVGNPYPSTIDWDAAGWTRTNINNAIYMRDNGQSGVFATYISGASVNGGSRYIPTGQAFFVKSDGGTIDFRATESVKAAGTQTTFFRQETVNDFLRMTLSGNGVRDEAVIRFQKEASDVYNSKQDARKLRNGSDTSPIVSLSSISSDGVLLAINSANPLGCKNLVPFKKIALMIDGVRAGSHQLSFSQLDSFTEDIMIVLHDQFKKDSVVVNQSNFAYDFDVTSDAKSFGRDRFSISFTCKNLITSIPDNKENSIHIFPNPASDKVQIEIPYNSNIVATMLNSVGVPIGKVALIKEGDFWKGEFDLGSHATGFYFVQVSEGTKVYAKKVIKR